MLCVLRRIQRMSFQPMLRFGMRIWPLLRIVWTRRTPVTVTWADITWMPSSTSLSPSDVIALMSCSLVRLLVLPRPCRPLLSDLPCLGGGSDPASPSTRGLTLPLGIGSGLVSSSVTWDDFVPGLWEYVQPENEEGDLEVIEKVPQNLEANVPEGPGRRRVSCVRSTKCLTGSTLRLESVASEVP